MNSILTKALGLAFLVCFLLGTRQEGTESLNLPACFAFVSVLSPGIDFSQQFYSVDLS